MTNKSTLTLMQTYSIDHFYKPTIENNYFASFPNKCLASSSLSSTMAKIHEIDNP